MAKPICRKKMTCEAVGTDSVYFTTVSGSTGRDAEVAVRHIAVVLAGTPSDFFVADKVYTVIIQR